MSEQTRRSVTLRRTAPGAYVATNAHGVELPVGSTGEHALTPVELLLAAIAGCTAIDVDTLASRRAEPDSFVVEASADKVRAESGNQLENVEVVFRVAFPPGAAGDTARELLPELVARSHDRLCTVSRTVERATPVTPRIE